MPRRATLPALLLPALVAAPLAAQEAAEAGASAAFIDGDGAEIGTASVADAPEGGVLLAVEIEGLPADHWVAFHIHETGECDPADGFDSAGGHFNPTDAEHGYDTEGGPHAGDMPNQYVPESGTLRAQIFNHMVALDGEPSVRGLALIVHEAHDDYATQPTGDAGGRLACAVIE